MFSPDGQAIAFFSPEDRALKRIDIAGGAPVTVTSLETALENTSPPLGGTWSGDSIFFGVTSGPNRGIVRAPDNGGKPEVVVKVSEQEWADAPQMLPDGEHLLFTLGRGTIADRWEKAQIIVQSLKSGDRKVLIDGGSDGRYLKSGHLLYAQGGVVFATRFDSRRLEVAGGTVPILQGVRRGIGAITSSAAQYSVSDTGSLVYIPGPITIGFTDLSVALLDRKGALEGLKFRAGPYRDPRVSPDGKQLAVATDDGKDAAVWLYGLSGAASIRRLTQGGKNRFPVWSHDGQRVFFQSDRDGDAAIFWQRADGTGAAERLTKPETGVTHVPESASPDGKWLLFGSTKSDVVSSMTLSLPDRKTAPFGDVRSTNPINAVFSPDGKWVAYTSRPAGSSAQIYVQPFPASGVPYQVSREKANPHHPFWSRDGRDLYYVPAPGQFAYIGVTTSPAFAFSDPVPLSRGPFSFVEGGPSNNRQNDATPDGRVVAIVAGNPMQAAPSGAEPQAQLQVVLNWVEELKARLPTK
jgi:Tol biopolymer transport system component